MFSAAEKPNFLPFPGEETKKKAHARRKGENFMKKMTLRTTLELLLAGLLLLTAGLFALRAHLEEKEFSAYREGIFSRSYESLISFLTDYRKSEDSRLAFPMAYCFSALPLSVEEESNVGRFLADLKRGEQDGEAKERAARYAGELLRFLSESRTDSYREGRKNGSLGLPAYPLTAHDSLPAYTMPQEESGGGEKYRAKAEKLLRVKGRLRAYTARRERSLYEAVGDDFPDGSSISEGNYAAEGNKTPGGDGTNGSGGGADFLTVYGFRTAAAYVEFSAESGRLLRALLPREPDAALPDEEALLKTAEAFLDENGYPGAAMLGFSSDGGIALTRWESEGMTLTLGLTAARGELCFFLAEAKKI